LKAVFFSPDRAHFGPRVSFDHDRLQVTGYREQGARNLICTLFPVT
jgi:hypothetical protein